MLRVIFDAVVPTVVSSCLCRLCKGGKSVRLGDESLV